MNRERDIDEIFFHVSCQVLAYDFRFFPILSLTVELNEKLISYSDSSLKSVSNKPFSADFSFIFYQVAQGTSLLEHNYRDEKI